MDNRYIEKQMTNNNLLSDYKKKLMCIDKIWINHINQYDDDDDEKKTNQTFGHVNIIVVVDVIFFYLKTRKILTKSKVKSIKKKKLFEHKNVFRINCVCVCVSNTWNIKIRKTSGKKHFIISHMMDLQFNCGSWWKRLISTPMCVCLCV